MTPDDARARFAGARVARLATASGDGTPHLVPIVFAVDGDRIVTAIDAKPKRGTMLRRLENIEANPLVSVLVDEYEEDWARLWWVRADGHARVVSSGPEAEDAMTQIRKRYRQYRSVALVGPAIVIDVKHWTGWNG